LPENIGSGGFDRKGRIDDPGQNDVAVAIPVEVAHPPINTVFSVVVEKCAMSYSVA